MANKIRHLPLGWQYEIVRLGGTITKLMFQGIYGVSGVCAHQMMRKLREAGMVERVEGDRYLYRILKGGNRGS